MVVTAPAATVPVAGRDREGAGVLPTVSPTKTHPGMAHTLAVGESTPGWFDRDALLWLSLCCLCFLQIQLTDECLLRNHRMICESKSWVNRYWVGPFMASVGVHHADYIKPLLKS